MQCRLKQNLFFWCSKIIVVLSNACIGPSSRNKMYFFLLSVCLIELLSTLKIFLPKSKFENGYCQSNSVPNPE